MTSWAILHIIKEDSRYLSKLFARILAALRGGSRLDKGVLLHEEAAARLLSVKTLGKLCVAALVCNLLLNSGTTASLTSDRLRANYLISLGIDADFVDFFDAAVLGDIRRCGLLGPLRGCFLKSACMAGSTLSIDSVLTGH